MRQPRRPAYTSAEARLLQQAIGAKLRQLFEDVVAESAPDAFLEILRKAGPKRLG
jgi:hypothetical protein